MPTTRNRNAAPNTAAASREACRRVGASWLASAPTAKKIAAGATRDRARKAAAVTVKCASGTRPAAKATAAVAVHRAPRPKAIAATARAAAPRRVVWPTTSSSHRPESSSPRSQRVAASSAQMEPRIVTIPRLRQAVHPATVSSARPDPNSARRAPLPPTVVAIAWRLCGVS